MATPLENGEARHTHHFCVDLLQLNLEVEVALADELLEPRVLPFELPQAARRLTASLLSACAIVHRLLGNAVLLGNHANRRVVKLPQDRHDLIVCHMQVRPS